MRVIDDKLDVDLLTRLRGSRSPMWGLLTAWWIFDSHVLRCSRDKLCTFQESCG